jgi:hypothetical protein
MSKLNPAKLPQLVNLYKPEEKSATKVDLNTFLKDGLAKPDPKPAKTDKPAFEFGIDDDSDA